MLNLQPVHEIRLVEFGWLFLIPLLPLLGAAVNGLLTLFAARRPGIVPHALHAAVGCGASILAFLAAWSIFQNYQEQPAGTQFVQTLAPWMESGPLKIGLDLQADALSMTMAVFITFVSALIHLYSIGYMKGDPGFGRYFCYLNLFLFSMLVLVLAKNLALLFLGWEGVGFCSYLLIGFWFTDEAKANAGKKAIIVNRIGDAGFLAGLLILFALAGTLDFNGLQAHQKHFTEAAATVVCLLLFFGATGKSAQIPLHVWLPDAMAGPTPVSALIHAATMVTAGVYLVARLHFLFALAPLASSIVAVVGILTALFAATIALAQNDIKKVLAYSTISQLGFMFVAAGVGAYAAAVFHLVTHGFFKACLFLGAGSVIHAMKGEQDIRKMGGLLKHLPLTSLAFLAGIWALSGLPPFAGFFSKDEVLWHALATSNPLFPFLPQALYFTGLFTAFLTAFYATRLAAKVFFGEFKGSPGTFEGLHESSRVMTLPLLILGFGSLVVGWLGMPEAIGGGNTLGRFLEPLFHLSSPELDAVPHKMAPLLMLMSILVAGLGVGTAWYVYGLKHVLSPKVFKFIPGGRRTLEDKYYVDELYDVTVVRWVKGLADWVSRRVVEELLVNRLLDAAVAGFHRLAQGMKRLQMGLVRAYLGYITLGAAALLYFVLH